MLRNGPDKGERRVLPDYLQEGLLIVFCGTVAGKQSAKRGHYYAGTGNEFWGTLLETGLISEPLGPSLDSRILEFGLGLTDLAKGIAASSDRGLRSSYDVPGFLRKIGTYRPKWTAFHGKEAAKEVSAFLGHGPQIRLGEQAWLIESAKVFVVPSMSGSNRSPKHLEGKARREDWYLELAKKVGRSP
jgi:TDG/mug DNA glycosylase family protein